MFFNLFKIYFLQINFLENKISKALVDSLIDIHLDDVPLIVKESLNSDKCASCGQPLHVNPKGNQGHNRSLSSVNEEAENKYNLKNLHDNCIKYGTGSYSRILSNSDKIKEEFIKLNKSVQKDQKEITNKSMSDAKNLPDIKDIKTVFNKDNKKNIKLKFLNEDLENEKRLNTEIDTELSKKFVKAEALLKSTNKFYEAEKKFKDFNKKTNNNQE